MSQDEIGMRRRVRSLSISADFLNSHNDDYYFQAFHERRQKLLLSSERSRTLSTDCDRCSRNNDNISWLSLCGEKFDFWNLGDDCKLEIFSYLSTREKGIAGQVCKEWNLLIKCPQLWRHIDLDEFALCYSRSVLHRTCREFCYDAFKKRVKSFLRFLVEIRPVVNYFRFSLDIGDRMEGWLELLQSVIWSARCAQLRTAEFNWNETRLTRLFMVPNSGTTWSTANYNDMANFQRRRQRQFLKFFDLFTAKASKIVKLVLPLDWSPSSVQMLSRCEHLEVLELKQYFSIVSIDRGLFCSLFRSLKKLQHLYLEVQTDSYDSFKLCSASLTYLDISHCLGFYLDEVMLPCLKMIYIDGNYHDSFLSHVNYDSVPCLYKVLCKGAANLLQINNHELKLNWNDELYPELDNLLSTVCCCNRHRQTHTYDFE